MHDSSTVVTVTAQPLNPQLVTTVNVHGVCPLCGFLNSKVEHNAGHW